MFPYAVRGRACVVWSKGAWVALCKVTAPALCLPARPPDLFALYLLKLWAGGAWERELQSSLKMFSIDSGSFSRRAQGLEAEVAHPCQAVWSGRSHPAKLQ